MKKLLVLLLAFVMVFSFAACGGGGDDGGGDVQGDQQQQEQGGNDVVDDPDVSAWLKTKTGKFYSQFEDGMYMRYQTEFEGMTSVVTSATKGDKSYTQTTVNGTSAGESIIDGTTMYTIDHTSKIIMEMNIESTGQEIATTIVEEEDISVDDIITGTREVNGKTYDTEEFVLEGATTIMCFDGNSLEYMIGIFEGEEITMEILEYSDVVDDAWFELPEGYQTMSF